MSQGNDCFFVRISKILFGFFFRDEPSKAGNLFSANVATNSQANKKRQKRAIKEVKGAFPLGRVTQTSDRAHGRALESATHERRRGRGRGAQQPTATQPPTPLRATAQSPVSSSARVHAAATLRARRGTARLYTHHASQQSQQ